MTKAELGTLYQFLGMALSGGSRNVRQSIRNMAHGAQMNVSDSVIDALLDMPPSAVMADRKGFWRNPTEPLEGET